MLQVSEFQLASQTIASNYASVAFVTIALYDYLLTLGEEVEFVWQQKMSFGNVLFILNRYMPMIDLVIYLSLQEDELCLAFIRLNTWMRLFCYVVINMLLLLRTWALWGMSKTILICLSILMAVCVVAASGPSLYISFAVIEVPSLGSIQTCLYAIPRAEIVYIYCVSLIVFDSAVMILTLIKAVPARQSNGLTPLITQLLKDGIQYFIIIFLTAILIIIMAGVAPGSLVTTVLNLYSVLTSTLGCRLILNLRGSILRPASDTEDATIELTTVVFNHHSDDSTVAMRRLVDDNEVPESTARLQDEWLTDP